MTNLEFIDNFSTALESKVKNLGEVPVLSRKYFSIQQYMETIRGFCPYCLEFYLLAYIVKDKLTMKQKNNKAKFEKEHGSITKVSTSV